MATTKDWTFTQLAGDKKTFVLTSSWAPHGRPRKGPIAVEALEIRESETYYSGRDTPTRNIYGLKVDPIELKGRFMDQTLGSGGAKSKARELKLFIKDEQQINIRWGDICSWNGLMKRVELGRESEAEIAWKIRLLIDEDLDQKVTSQPPKQQSLQQTMQALTKSLNGLTTSLPASLPSTPSLDPGFLDGLSDLISAVNAPFAALVNLSTQVKSFAQALVGDLRQLRAGVNQLNTAILNLRDAVDSVIESPTTTSIGPGQFGSGQLGVITSTSSISWANVRSAADAEATNIAALLADLDRAAEIQIRGQLNVTVMAQDGDSWESLSRKVFSGANRAQDLKDANGVRYGSKPVPGKIYHVPN